MIGIIDFVDRRIGNDLRAISEARAKKQEARSMADAIRELDVFQSVFNLPCHYTPEQQIFAIHAEITKLEICGGCGQAKHVPEQHTACVPWA